MKYVEIEIEDRELIRKIDIMADILQITPDEVASRIVRRDIDSHKFASAIPKTITIKQAAEIMGKCQQFVRIGLQRNLLPFGTAIKTTNRWNYYISPKLFYEYVGRPDSLDGQALADNHAALSGENAVEKSK